MSKIQAAIREVLTEIKRIDIAKKRISQLFKQVELAQRELEQLGKILDKEYRDVERLEELGIRSLFFKILGNHETQLETERQEYLQAVLHYQERKRTIDLLLREQDLLMAKINQERNHEDRLKALLDQRSAELSMMDLRAKQEIKALDIDIDHQFSTLREIHEALIVGAKVKQQLDQLVGYLSIAEAWGHTHPPATGIFNGNEELMAQQKRDIDRAVEIAIQVKHTLARYQIELMDVYERQNIKIHFNLAQFDQFIEEHFDHLITDWVIQKKIYHALHYVTAFADRILKTQHSLKASIVAVEKKLNGLEAQKEQLILSYQ